MQKSACDRFLSHFKFHKPEMTWAAAKDSALKGFLGATLSLGAVNTVQGFLAGYTGYTKPTEMEQSLTASFARVNKEKGIVQLIDGADKTYGMICYVMPTLVGALAGGLVAELPRAAANALSDPRT